MKRLEKGMEESGDFVKLLAGRNTRNEERCVKEGGDGRSAAPEAGVRKIDGVWGSN